MALCDINPHHSVPQVENTDTGVITVPQFFKHAPLFGDTNVSPVEVTEEQAKLLCEGFDPCGPLTAEHLKSIMTAIYWLNQQGMETANKMPAFEPKNALLFSRAEANVPAFYANNSTLTLPITSHLTATEIAKADLAVLHVRCKCDQHMNGGNTNPIPNTRNEASVSGAGYIVRAATGVDFGDPTLEAQDDEVGIMIVPIVNGLVNLTYTLRVNMGWLSDDPVEWSADDYTASSVTIRLVGVMKKGGF